MTEKNILKDSKSFKGLTPGSGGNTCILADTYTPNKAHFYVFQLSQYSVSILRAMWTNQTKTPQPLKLLIGAPA